MLIQDIELEIISKICDLRIINDNVLNEQNHIISDLIDDTNAVIIDLIEDISIEKYAKYIDLIENIERYAKLWSNIDYYNDRHQIMRELSSILDRIELGVYGSNSENKSAVSKVILVNIDRTSEDVLKFVNAQSYNNILPIDFYSFRKIIKYSKCEYINDKYVAFIEEKQSYHVEKIKYMMDDLRKQYCNIIMCPLEYYLPDGTLLHGYSDRFSNTCCNQIVPGKGIIQYSIDNNINTYGYLSNLLCKGSIFTSCRDILDSIDGKIEDNKNILLFNILIHNYIYYGDRVLVYKIVKNNDDRIDIISKKKFFKNVNHLVSNNILRAPNYSKYYNDGIKRKVKKEITIFYTDSAEYFCIEPIANSAKKRGYKVNFSEDISEHAEIGIYAYHAVYTVISKLSIIMLHDMAQRHDIWPNIWYSENWNNFDIGILPGKQWADRWSLCASASYVRPKVGAFMLGYPKADALRSLEIKKRAMEIKSKLKYDFTILYAPSWENDGKEDDFVQALFDLPVNLLIKQCHVPDKPWFKFLADNQKAMRNIHDNKYDNLMYLDRDDNIILGLEICDMVISDESSVMTEATFFNKPSLAVIDWLIPDRVPSREAIVPVEYIIKTKKAHLRESVLRFLNESGYYEQACELGRDFFANKGNASEYIMDLIDACVENRKIPDNVEALRVTPKYESTYLWS